LGMGAWMTAFSLALLLLLLAPPPPPAPAPVVLLAGDFSRASPYRLGASVLGGVFGGERARFLEAAVAELAVVAALLGIVDVIAAALPPRLCAVVVIVGNESSEPGWG
jgi:hypothetical protein